MRGGEGGEEERGRGFDYFRSRIEIYNFNAQQLTT
jgi:hypothetical protein